MFWLGSLVALVLDTIHVNNSQAACLWELLLASRKAEYLFVSTIVASWTRYPRYSSQVTGSGGAASFCYTDEHLKPVKATGAHHQAPFHCTHQCNIVMPSSCAQGEVTNFYPKFVSKPLHETNAHCTHSTLWGGEKSGFRAQGCRETDFAGTLSAVQFAFGAENERGLWQPSSPMGSSSLGPQERLCPDRNPLGEAGKG